jgi:hypothetical protein
MKSRITNLVIDVFLLKNATLPRLSNSQLFVIYIYKDITFIDRLGRGNFPIKVCE